ncbi:MAG: ATPase domain-containing protein [Candidatus Thermoplasmatota archaeon]|nr:ATPase domain-containing protein [Candidatus Thermoplasmatota archaeon]
MLRDAVKGLDRLFEKDIPEGFIILITGTPGTLKSGFVHQVLSNHLARAKKFGVYATLEEPKESHLRNMRSLGIKKVEGLEIFDYSDIRKEWKAEEETLDMVKITEDIIGFYKEKKGEDFTCFALDSLNALYSLVKSTNLRSDSYHFFTALRESGLTSFITLELPKEPGEYAPEYFLVDGVIEVGVIETREDVTRYVQIKKMRAVKHSMKKHQLVVEEDGLAVLGPVYE